jgi:hypothetical protein
MLAALALAAATALPTISMSVHAAPHVSRWVVTFALEEARAIWRDAGVHISWQIGEERSKPGVVRVVINDDPGTDLGDGLAIGWVVFNGDEPRPEIHLSYRNAFTGLERSCPVGTLTRLIKLRIDEVVAIGLGRALAHEVGHYLLGANVHTATGLMRAEWSPAELFGEDRPRIRLEAAQRGAILSKLLPEAIVTNR